MTDGSDGFMSGTTLLERLFARIVEGDNGCWAWTGYHDERGRPRFSIHDHPRLVYRLLYEEVVGPVPRGLYLDHLCRNPGCVNPAHLEPVEPLRGTQEGRQVSGISGVMAQATPPARLLICLGPCHGEFYLPLDLDDPIICPNDRTHPVALYSSPTIHLGERP